MSIDSRPSATGSAEGDSAPRAGEVLAGRYYVERVLGRGGMGCVVAATHVHLDERVAVKLLHRHLVSDGDTVQRFLREGRTAGRIQSEHVVRIKDVGELDDGCPYIVMEYLEGEDLAAVQKRKGMLPPQQAVDYVLAAADAIAEAHAMKMLHRDIKPSNIFLARLPDGREIIKVLDFGIAKAFGEESLVMHLTATATVMGTPLFMAPEQLRKAKTLDPRVDIWALGVLLHRLVTNTLPFDGDTFAELSAAILTADPPPIRRAYPHLSKELEAIITTCLKKNPDERFVDLADLALALAPLGTPASQPNVERILRTLGSPSQRAIVVAKEDTFSSMTTGGSLSAAVNVTPVQPPPPRKSSGSAIAFVSFAVLLALGGLVAGGLALRARARAAATTQLVPTPVAATAGEPSSPVEPRVNAPPGTSADAPPVAAASTASSTPPSPPPKTLGRVGKPGAAPKTPAGAVAAPPTTAAIPAAAPSTPSGIATSSKD